MPSTCSAIISSSERKWAASWRISCHSPWHPFSPPTQVTMWHTSGVDLKLKLRLRLRQLSTQVNRLTASPTAATAAQLSAGEGRTSACGCPLWVHQISVSENPPTEPKGAWPARTGLGLGLGLVLVLVLV